jgi:hypothetical protein
MTVPDISEEYSITMDRLKDAYGWEVGKIIADVALRLYDNGDGESAAVVDFLVFALKLRQMKL